jgi:uncharacterized protein (TIGR03086 family)
MRSDGSGLRRRRPDGGSWDPRPSKPDGSNDPSVVIDEMRRLPDATDLRPGHDERVKDPGRAAGGWAQEVQQLILHGRDREAAELAARHLHDDPNDSISPTKGDTTMGPLEQLDELEPLLGRVASGITADDLDAPTPCANFTVRGVLGHMVGGAVQFAAAFRGETPPEVSADIAEDPDVVARTGTALSGLMAAIRSPGALDRAVAAPFGEMPGDAFARFVVLDGLVHGWDLATATQQTYEPSAALVAAVNAFAHRAIAPAMRDGDTFADALEAPAGATSMERLASFTGRRI